jgi:hypothetical protein
MLGLFLYRDLEKCFRIIAKVGDKKMYNNQVKQRHLEIYP